MIGMHRLIMGITIRKKPGVEGNNNSIPCVIAVNTTWINIKIQYIEDPILFDELTKPLSLSTSKNVLISLMFTSQIILKNI